uniref:Proteasome subunit beta n=1 Tax=Laticauda laticaudata TaxID=8630 RepID=A0A8C5STP8_LATLA
KGLRLPAARKTGTTIAGVVYKDGIVLGADTRATEGMVVADKNCDKIHFIAPNIYCCGAGTAADTEMTTQMISSNMELHSLSTGRLPRVVTANRMLKQMLFRYLIVVWVGLRIQETKLQSYSHKWEGMGDRSDEKINSDSNADFVNSWAVLRNCLAERWLSGEKLPLCLIVLVCRTLWHHFEDRS